MDFLFRIYLIFPSKVDHLVLLIHLEADVEILDFAGGVKSDFVVAQVLVDNQVVLLLLSQGKKMWTLKKLEKIWTLFLT